MGQIIDCAAIAQKIKDEVKEKTAGKTYTLICLSNPLDEASKSYIRNKRKVCEEVGITFIEMKLDEYIDLAELGTFIKTVNAPTIIQLPICNNLSDFEKSYALSLITPEIDVDGFGKDALVTPATANGVMKIFEEIDYDLTGKHVCVVGRGKTCAAPIVPMLLKKNATVTICHSYTQNLAEITNKCDAIITAVGKAHLITADHVKEGAVVINVGLSRNEDGKLCGDVDFEAVKDKAAYITKNIGGVGLLTTACLVENVVNLYERR